jgi:Bacterial SH3 domain
MRSSAEKPLISELAARFAEPLLGEGHDIRTAGAMNRQAKDRIMVPPVRVSVAIPDRTDGRNEKAAPVRWLIAALVTVALVPMGMLIVMLWPGAIKNQQPHSTPTAVQGTAPAASEQTAAVPASRTLPDIALTSPEKIEARAGEEVDFAIAVDSEEPLPPRSLIAISAMPEGASFSEGRPYGVTGWSLRPDEIGELRLRLPKTQHGTSDLHIELVTGDGTRLAQSEIRLDITQPMESEMVGAVEAAPSQQAAPAPQIVQAAETPMPAGVLPLPLRQPASAANIEPAVKVATVKVVTIKAPEPKRQPHDGAWALGQAAEAPAEWVEIVSAVDMHARPQQSSQTVKVVEKGLKLRVTARDRNWVQVSDPKTSTQGWIYKRFLKPAEPPA